MRLAERDPKGDGASESIVNLTKSRPIYGDFSDALVGLSYWKRVVGSRLERRKEQVKALS